MSSFIYSIYSQSTDHHKIIGSVQFSVSNMSNTILFKKKKKKNEIMFWFTVVDDGKGSMTTTQTVKHFCQAWLSVQTSFSQLSSCAQK